MFRVYTASGLLSFEESDVLDAISAMKSLGPGACVVNDSGKLLATCEQLSWRELHLVPSQAGYPCPYELPFPERVRKERQRKAAA